MSTNPSHYYQRQMEETVIEAKRAIDHVASRAALDTVTETTVLENVGGLIVGILACATVGLALAMIVGGVVMGVLS